MFNRKDFNVAKLKNEIKNIKEAYKRENFEENIDINKFNGEMRELVEEFNELLVLVNEERKAKEFKFDLIVGAAKIGLWDLTLKDGIPTEENIYSGKAKELFGYEDENDFPNLYSAWAETVHPEDKPYLHKISQMHFEDKTGTTPFEAEYRGKTKSGEYRWYKMMANSVRDKNGVPLRNMGAFIDVHEQKMELEKLNTLLNRLAMVNQALELSPSSSEGTWGYELDLNEDYSEDIYCWYSPQLIRLLGFEGEEDFPPVVGSLFNRIHPDDASYADSEFKRILKEERGYLDIEYRIKDKKGQYHWFHLLSKTKKDNERNKIQLSGVLKDITDDKLKREIEEEFMANMNEFSASVSQLAEGTRNLSREAQGIADEYDLSSQSANIAKMSVDKTKSITDLIKEISTHISLLGLNASIEASRAGEQGKGFAVVASEVRKLAIDSSEAVDEIEKIMYEINKSVNSIIESVENMREKATSQASTTEEINATTEYIKEMSLELLNVVHELQKD